MNQALRDTFRHNGWASLQLIEACRGLPPERLAQPGPGAYGGILDTLNHVVRSDAGYLGRLLGDGLPDWVEARDDTGDFDVLTRRVEETTAGWEPRGARAFDGADGILMDAGKCEA